MKIEIELKDYVYSFYNKVSESSGVPLEKVMADALEHYAAHLADSIYDNKHP